MPLLLPVEGEIAASDSCLLQQIRRSCKQELDASSVVAIDYDVAKRYAESLVESLVKEAASINVRLPLQFPDRPAEVDVLMLLHFLSFGSGYEQLLQTECKASADEIMKFGVLGMYISGAKLDADFFANFSDFQVNNFFRIPTHVEVPSEMHPAIQVSQPGPLMPLARAIRQQLQQLGKALQEGNATSAGEHVIHRLMNTASASEAIASLVDFLPGFKDCGTDTSPGPALFSKAQSLLEVLCTRFGAEEQPIVSASFKDELTASADNVLPAILRHIGVIQVSDEANGAINAGEDLSATPWVGALRAATIAAVDFLAESANPELKPREVEAYLRAHAVSRDDNLSLPLVRDTVFF